VSKRARNKFDNDVSRAFLGLMGMSIIAIGVCIAVFVTPASSTVDIVSAGITILGCVVLAIGILGNNKQSEAWAENLGRHEITIVFVLLAYGVVWLFRRKK
jgi:membrane protein YdbS with pleckstrin-like domain